MSTDLVSPRVERFAATIRDRRPVLLRASGPGLAGVPWHGSAVEYRDPYGQIAYALWRDMFTTPGTRRYALAGSGLYLIDDGLSVSPFYVAGSAPHGDPHVMFIHPVQPGSAHPTVMCWHITVSPLAGEGAAS